MSVDQHSHRGRLNHAAGAAAEDSVANEYARRGQPVVARRWRGPGGGGEIDLIARDGTGYVFVEVKKGTSHDGALARVSHRQIHRIMASAEEFVGTLAGGSLTEMRFDVATVDSSGRIRILENAFAHL